MGAIIWRLELLGPLRARHGERSVDRFQTRATERLLAYLALHAPGMVARQELTAQLWPDAEPESARVRLTQALSWLRTHLDEALFVADRLGIGLAAGAYETDLDEFESFLRSAERHPDQAADHWAAAITLYRGDLLPGHDDDGIFEDRERYRVRLLSALRGMIRTHGRTGRFADALPLARRAFAIDPYSDRSQIDLLRCLVRNGDWDGARRQFAAISQLMRQEFGEAPAKAVQLIVRQGEIQIGPRRLPAVASRFFGREESRQQVLTCLRSDPFRMVTLTGLGGVGKTRLALEVAQDTTLAFHDRIWFVPLAEVRSGVVNRILDTLQLPQNGDPMRLLVDALAPQPSLLILDNLEHLRDEAARVCAELLRDCPLLTVLATSRIKLAIEGEVEIPLRALPSETGTAGPEMFVDRARRARADFADGPWVKEIVRRLEGIPLAIELCAAWAGTLGAEELLARLDRRFELLVSTRLDATDRHRSLRAALEGSYLLLTEPQRRAMRALSTFRGGWTLDAAAAVTGLESGPLATVVKSLQEASLISRLPAAASRYGMLETVREFVTEQLDPDEVVEDARRHADFFTRWVQRAGSHFGTADEAPWLGVLSDEVENVTEALAWACHHGNGELAVETATTMGTFWYLKRRYAEGVAQIRQALAVRSTPDALTAAALSRLGQLYWSLGDYEAAAEADKRALSIREAIGDADGIADSNLQLAVVAYRQGQYRDAWARLEAAHRAAESAGNRALTARILLNFGNVADAEGRSEEAREMFQSSLEIQAQTGNRYGMANALNNLGLLDLDRGDLAAAERRFNAAMAARISSASPGTEVERLNLASVALARQDGRVAREHLRQGLALAHAALDRFMLAHYLLAVGRLLIAEGKDTGAAHLIYASRQLLQELAARPSARDQANLEEAVRTLANRLTPAEQGIVRSHAQSQSFVVAVSEAFHALEEPISE